MLERRILSFTTKEVRILTDELCKANYCSNPFKSVAEVAGVDWLHRCLKRPPDIHLRKVETASAAHTVGFAIVAVSQFLICWQKRLMNTFLRRIKFAL